MVLLLMTTLAVRDSAADFLSVRRASIDIPNVSYLGLSNPQGSLEGDLRECAQISLTDDQNVDLDDVLFIFFRSWL